MNADIRLKSGVEVLIDNVRCIKHKLANGSFAEQVNLEEFILYKEPYVFIGDKVFSANGADIEYVLFRN